MATPPDTAVGIDVGGTRIRAGRIARDGTLSGHVIEPVRTDRPGFTEQVLRLIAETRDATSAAVGIGIPGRVDPVSGVIRSAGYLDLADFDLGRRVADETGLPVRVENDATMALLAEAHARPEGSDGVMLIMTVGTGIGGAVLVDGAPWHGGGISGQFGHVVVSAEDAAVTVFRVTENDEGLSRHLATQKASRRQVEQGRDGSGIGERKTPSTRVGIEGGKFHGRGERI